MILWQKQVSLKWLARHESQLREISGCDLAIITRPGRARSLMQVTCRRQAKVARLLRNFGGIAEPLPGDWWKQSRAEGRAPIRIGRRLEIVSEPTDAPNSNRKSQLIIPAAGAFGTGEHATTAMSLRLLEEITRELPPGWRLFDAGTGTGILALAARKLGASEVLGLDLDPGAIAHARQNARLNHISRAKFIATDLLRWRAIVRYDLITANLFSELFIAALPIFRRSLRREGRLIVSGLLREQAETVVRALCHSGFPIEKQRRRGKWVALIVRRASD